MSWLNKIFGGSSVVTTKAEVSTGLSAEDKKMKESALAAELGIPSFERRKIDFAYSKSYAMNVKTCPKCETALVRNYADLVYLTKKSGKAESVISASGYFCTACPTVVIDEKALAQESGNAEDYEQAVAIDEIKPITFRTFDEESVSYSYDEKKRVSKMKFVESPTPNLNEEGTAEEDNKNKKGERKPLSATEVKRKKKTRSLANKTKRVNRGK